MTLIEEIDVPQKKKILIWTDYPESCLAAAKHWQSEGHLCHLRDAKFFNDRSVEAADILVFGAAARESEIIGYYRETNTVKDIGVVKCYRMEVDKQGKPKGIPKIFGEEPVKKTPTKTRQEFVGDRADARLDGMDSSSLRTMYRAQFGSDPPANMDDDKLREKLKNPEEGKK